MLESPFNKVTSLRGCKFIKKIPQHRCFPVQIAKFLRTPILKMAASNHSFTLLIYLFSAVKKRLFIEIILCNPMMLFLKSMSKSLK